MARIIYIRNPSQPDDCLSGAMAAYIRRIPPRFDSFSDAVAYLSRAKFEADDGKSGDDHRCFPAQRARIWPSTFNCWEATAHIAAEGARLLPRDWIIRVHDQNYGAYRHVWATLELPGCWDRSGRRRMGRARTCLECSTSSEKRRCRCLGRGRRRCRRGAAGDALPDWAKRQADASQRRSQARRARKRAGRI